MRRTFLKFHRNREQIDPNKPLQPLLNCIAENVITDYLREQAAEKRDYRLTCKLNQAGPGASDEDGCQLGMGYTDPKSRWIEAAQDAKQVLAEPMETLPPNEETALRLVWLEGYTEEEAAKKMNAPVSSAKWWIRSGKERLRRLGGGA